MALTHQRAMEVANELKACGDQVKAALHRVRMALDTNSDLAIDWGNATKPAFLNEDSAGNLDGFKFTRQQLSNVIGSLDKFRALMGNEDPGDAADHLGNLNQLAEAGVQS